MTLASQSQQNRAQKIKLFVKNLVDQFYRIRFLNGAFLRFGKYGNQCYQRFCF